MSFLTGPLLGYQGRLFEQPRAKTGQCFIASMSSLKLILQEEGIRVRKRQYRSGKNTHLLNKRTKCFKEIDPKGMEAGPGSWHPGGVAGIPNPLIIRPMTIHFLD